MHILTRRHVLRQALGLAGAVTLSSLGLPRTSMASLPPTFFRRSFHDYKALVCVFLNGGNDGFNLVVPRSQAEYGIYQQSRQNLAVSQSSLLAIHARSSQNGQFGLHAAMQALHPLFGQGALALIANLGPLVEPVTRAQYLNGQVRLPPQLFSHNDQQDQWHSLRGQLDLRTGWAGRLADQWQQAGGMSMNISLSGRNLFQTGTQGLPYAMNTDGPQTYHNLRESDWSREVSRRDAFLRMLESPTNQLGTAYAQAQLQSFQLADGLREALEGVELPVEFPAGNRLAEQLAMVARLLAVRDQIGLPRQVFYVSLGGFDTHDNQNALQPDLFRQLAEALQAFWRATEALGMADQVTSFTASDFGRTLTSNGDGTDHGWGSHHLVMGGAVRGGDIYGQMPDLRIDGDDDTRGGRLIPTLSADQYVATLAHWFGLDDSELDTLLPNLGNFTQRDLGFMRS